MKVRLQWLIILNLVLIFVIFIQSYIDSHEKNRGMISMSGLFDEKYTVFEMSVLLYWHNTFFSHLVEICKCVTTVPYRKFCSHFLQHNCRHYSKLVLFFSWQ